MSEPSSKVSSTLNVLMHPSLVGLLSSLAMSVSFYYLFSKKLSQQEEHNKRLFESQEENGQKNDYIKEQNKFKQQ